MHWQAIVALSALLLGAAGCRMSDESAARGEAAKRQAPQAAPQAGTAATSDQFDASPPKIAAARWADGGLCPVDSVNRQRASSAATASKAAPFGVEGWAVVPSPDRPVPPLVFARLQGAGGEYFLEGRRKPRPDVAQGNPLLEMAGYEVAGYLSRVPAGEYSLSVVTGDSGALVRCDTKVGVKVVD